MFARRIPSSVPPYGPPAARFTLPRGDSARRFFRSSPCPYSSSYAATLKNLDIGASTRVIFQGFTGRQGTANAKESLAWGTQIVGGVTPGREGMHPIFENLPVLPTVKAAMRELKPDATGIYVPANHAAAAIEEAIEAEVPLIVVVAEHIPVHDMLRIHSMLQSQSKSRLVGANAPGIISPIGRCRIGFQPLSAFSPGHVGIVAKSGTLSYETVASLTRAGVGQSLCIGMGGDIVAGTDFVDALTVFEHHDDTHGIILVGEVGGHAEEEAAEWIKEYHRRCASPKPIAALVAGEHIKPGYVMGHAGAWRGLAEHTAKEKYKALEKAGVVMVDHPSQFGAVMARELRVTSPSPPSPSNAPSKPSRRGYHTWAHRPRLGPNTPNRHRTLHIPAADAEKLLSAHGILTTRSAHATERERILMVTIDRSTRTPCFLVCRWTDPDPLRFEAKSFPFDFGEGPSPSVMDAAIKYLLDYEEDSAERYISDASNLLNCLYKIFLEYEGLALGIKIAIPSGGAGSGFENQDEHRTLLMYDPEFMFDDAALKSNNRYSTFLHALRDVSPSAIDPEELRAKVDGTVYVKLGPSDPSDPAFHSYNIGTLVNGAGLAMNTVDALALRGGRAANFLDTGGKATAGTVRRSLEMLLADQRVKVIFVNIFGGLTLCDMTAEGILLAFQKLGLEARGVPVVVRLRGTNEAEGQRILAESGLKNIFLFDGFDEAAAKCIALAEECTQ